MLVLMLCCTALAATQSTHPPGLLVSGAGFCSGRYKLNGTDEAGRPQYRREVYSDHCYVFHTGTQWEIQQNINILYWVSSNIATNPSSGDWLFSQDNRSANIFTVQMSQDHLKTLNTTSFIKINDSVICRKGTYDTDIQRLFSLSNEIVYFPKFKSDPKICDNKPDCLNGEDEDCALLKPILGIGVTFALVFFGALAYFLLRIENLFFKIIDGLINPKNAIEHKKLPV